MLFFGRKRNRDKRQDAESIAAVAHAVEVARTGATLVLKRVFVICTTFAVCWGTYWSFDRPITKVEVGGAFQRVAPTDIEQAIAPFRGAGFLSVDLAAVRHALESIAWVDEARVERAWPNGVRAMLIEHVPAARWGETGLLNARGELFTRNAQHVPQELPLLEGPEGSEREVAEIYLDTNRKLAAAGLRLTRVSLDARGALELALANGVQVRLGRQNIQNRLDRFVRAASPVIAARGAEVAYVDMRYSNGFAIGWNTKVASKRGEEMRDVG